MKLKHTILIKVILLSHAITKLYFRLFHLVMFAQPYITLIVLFLLKLHNPSEAAILYRNRSIEPEIPFA